MPPIAFIAALPVLAALIWWAARGDRRTDLRRCPSCWYDMSAVSSLTCPECGRAAASDAALHRSRRRRIAMWLGFAGIATCVFGLFWTASRSPWTHRLPSPVMMLLLDLAAEAPAPGSAGALATPTAAYAHSRSPWERMVWQHQLDRVITEWSEAVLAGSGPVTDAELARLAPLADQMHELYQESGGTRYDESWVSDRTTDRLARQIRRAKEDPDRLARLQWALAEAQFDGPDYSHRDDWAMVPAAVISQALQHPDAAVRAFGLERAWRFAYAGMKQPEGTLPDFRPQIQKIVDSDPDPKLRERAKLLFRR